MKHDDLGPLPTTVGTSAKVHRALAIKTLIEIHQSKHRVKADEALKSKNNFAYEAYTERAIALHDLLTDMEDMGLLKD